MDRQIIKTFIFTTALLVFSVALAAQQWPADPLMIKSMGELHQIHEELARSSDSKKQKDFARLIRKDTENMITHCELSPEADEAFHPLLAKMLRAASDLESGEKARWYKAHKALDQVFQQYQTLFSEAAGSRSK